MSIRDVLNDMERETDKKVAAMSPEERDSFNRVNAAGQAVIDTLVKRVDNRQLKLKEIPRVLETLQVSFLGAIAAYVFEVATGENKETAAA